MNKSIALGVLGCAILSCGCTVGPNYKKPVASVPATYRGLAPDATGSNGSGVSLGDEKWWDVFQDEQLRALIRTALQQNYDVRIAGTRILAAQAQLGITRADQFPRVAGGASLGDERTARTGAFRAFESGVGQLNITAAWELDFWGKFRRATEAARANLIASEAARQEVIVTLVANVSAAYFQLRALTWNLRSRSAPWDPAGNHCGSRNFWPTAARPRCSTSVRPNSWCSPPRRKSQRLSSKSSSRKT
jgi:multidrug efflux system outer membrane protein